MLEFKKSKKWYMDKISKEEETIVAGPKTLASFQKKIEAKKKLIKKNSEVTWLVNPAGETKNDAIIVCHELLRIVFGVYIDENENKQSLLERTGLVATQDDKQPHKWGIVCNKQTISMMIRKKLSQKKLDSLWKP